MAAKCFNRNECLLLLLLFLPFLSRDLASSCFLCGDIHSSDSSVKVIAFTPAICKDKPLSCPIYKCQRHGFMCIPASSILKGCCSLHGCWTKSLSNSPCPLQSSEQEFWNSWNYVSYIQSFLKYCILWHRSLVNLILFHLLYSLIALISLALLIKVLICLLSFVEETRLFSPTL